MICYPFCGFPPLRTYRNSTHPQYYTRKTPVCLLYLLPIPFFRGSEVLFSRFSVLKWLFAADDRKKPREPSVPGVFSCMQFALFPERLSKLSSASRGSRCNTSPADRRGSAYRGSCSRVYRWRNSAAACLILMICLPCGNITTAFILRMFSGSLCSHIARTCFRKKHAGLKIREPARQNNCTLVCGTAALNLCSQVRKQETEQAETHRPRRSQLPCREKDRAAFSVLREASSKHGRGRPKE